MIYEGYFEKNDFEIDLCFQPLSAESARGIVDGYRVQITDNGASKKTELSTESEDLKNYPFMIKLENLNRDKEYRVTIDAKTRKGFNESLELPVLLVPKQSEGEFSVLHLSCSFPYMCFLFF